jgi:non-heme chloroperoxidase
MIHPIPHQTLTYEDGDLFVSMQGNADAQTVLLFHHGYLQSHLTWDAQLDWFARHHMLAVSYDLLWHGRSQAREDLQPSPTVWAKMVATLVQFLGPRSTIIHVGWSFGGYILQCYLEQYGTAHVQAIVLVDALFGDMDRVMHLFQQRTPAVFQAVVTINDRDASIAARLEAIHQFVASLYENPPDAPEYALVFGYNVTAFRQQLTVPLLTSMHSFPQSSPLSGNLQSIPVALLWGEQDTATHIDNLVHLQQLFPRARVVTLPGGHAHHREHPGTFNTALTHFLAQAGL